MQKTSMCFEKGPWSNRYRILLELCCPRQQFKLRFSELITNMPKSRTFVYFAKILAATWPINKIIPVDISLGCCFFFGLYLWYSKGLWNSSKGFSCDPRILTRLSNLMFERDFFLMEWYLILKGNPRFNTI